jgi:hypothetical protein
MFPLLLDGMSWPYPGAVTQPVAHGVAEAHTGRGQVGEDPLLGLQRRVGRGVDGSDDGAATCSRDVRNRDARAVQDFEHPELRHRPCAPARKRDAELAAGDADAVTHHAAFRPR